MVQVSKGGTRPWLWSSGKKAGLEGSQEGTGTPFLVRDETADVSPWPGAGGEGNLQVPRVVNRRYGFMAQRGSMPMLCHGSGDATGVRSDPLAEDREATADKRRGYYPRTSCAQRCDCFWLIFLDRIML